MPTKLYKFHILDNDFSTRQCWVILNIKDNNKALSIGASKLKTANIRIVNVKEFNPAN